MGNLLDDDVVKLVGCWPQGKIAAWQTGLGITHDMAGEILIS